MAVDTPPAPQESFFGGADTSMSLTGLSGEGWANRRIFSAGTENPESVIFKGSKRRCCRNCASLIPDAASTTRPTTSLAKLYSHTVPGWCASGALLSAVTCSADVDPLASKGSPLG